MGDGALKRSLRAVGCESNDFFFKDKLMAVPHGPGIDAVIAEAPLRTVRRWMCATLADATGAEEIPRPLAALMDSTTRRSHAYGIG